MAIRTLDGMILDIRSRLDTLERKRASVVLPSRLTPEGLRAEVRGLSSSVNVRSYGAVGDGVADDTLPVIAAINSASPGETVLFPPGTYRVSSSITNRGKPLQFKATGARFVNSGSDATVSLTGSYGPIYSVSSVSSTTITEPSGSGRALSLTVTGGPPASSWNRGDIVKVVSDDEIPGSRDAGSGAVNQMRCGQFFVVYSYNGSTLVVAGSAVDSFSTNVRVAKFDSIPVSWEGGEFDISSGNSASFRTIDVTNLLRPSVENVSIRQSPSVGVAFNGCYAPSFDGVDVGWGGNDLVTDPIKIGYAVCNFSSQELTGTRLRAGAVRHGYDDGSGFIAAGSTVLQHYGRPLNSTISDSKVVGASGNAFDTHTSSMNTLFANCIASGCPVGFGLRGRDCQINGVKVSQCTQAAVRVFSESNGRSWGHTIDGVSIEDAVKGIEVYVGKAAGSLYYDVRETRAVRISNVSGRGISQELIALTNVRAYLSNITLAASDSNTTRAIYMYNSDLRGKNIDLDFAQRPASSGAIIEMDPTFSNMIEIQGFRARGDLTTRFSSVFDSDASQVIRVSDALLDQAPATVVPTLTSGGGWFDYQIMASAQDSSAILTRTTIGDSQLTQLARNRAPIQTLVCQVSANSTLGVLPAPPFIGAVLLIVNPTSYTITIRHGSAYRTANASGSTRTLGAGGYGMYAAVTASEWREVN